MKLKVSHAPKGHYICPDVDCKYTNSREEKIPTHVLGHHGKNFTLVTQALLERDNIRIAQQEAKENQKANKIKQEQEAKEERNQTQLANLAKNHRNNCRTNKKRGETPKVLQSHASQR